MKPIDFYFDFSSPYGYFASQKIEALAEKHGRTVDWHPMLLGVVFKQTGAAPLTEIPVKGPYSKRDFARSARFQLTCRRVDHDGLATLWTSSPILVARCAIAHAGNRSQRSAVAREQEG